MDSPRPRGDVRGLPLSPTEHEVLYQRAMTGSRKDAAAAVGLSPRSVHHHIASAYAKLGVEDLVAAFSKLDWLHPLPYGVSPAEARHERFLCDGFRDG
jgi:DNA-binding CsgD family transcriptional regulator